MESRQMGRYGRVPGAVLGIALLGPIAAWSQGHGHLNAGAVGTSPGDALYFANGHLFAAGSGYLLGMPYATEGRFAGYYNGNITLTALPTTLDNGGPTANASAPGSFLQVGIVSVDGPAGASFGFWDAGTTEPTFSYATGYGTGAPDLWALSDIALGAGTTPEADPYGHIHGRRFTTTDHGVFTVGFQLFDTSTHGPDGGPIHAASEIFTLQVQAVPEPGMVALFLLGLGGLVGRLRRA